MVIVYATDNYWPRISGMAVSIETFKRGLERRGHEVHVFCPNYPDADISDIEMKRTNIHRFSSYEMKFILNTEDAMVHLFQRSKVFETLDVIKPDLIHVQTEFTMGKFAIEYARKRHLPLIATSHTHFEEYIKIYFPFIPKYFASHYVRTRSKLTYNKTDILLVPTEPIKELQLRNGVKVPIEILPTGADESVFSNADPEIAKKKIKSISPKSIGKKSMLYVGRLGIEKNLHFLIDVVERVKKDIPDIVLFMIGEGPIRDAMEYIIKQKNLEENVYFLGYVPHQEIKHYFTYCDVFTFPSRTETQGLVTVESMMCGTPVVGVGELGTKSVMQGDNGGFMVSCKVEEFAMRTIQLLNDKVLYKQKSEEAKIFSQQFSIHALTDRLERIYEATIKKKRVKLIQWLTNKNSRIK
ncbi:MAG: glycosyltransferase [Spirochaetales bacterium]|nr:glycosyltransferase [Spirochaetales bacterium]